MRRFSPLTLCFLTLVILILPAGRAAAKLPDPQSAAVTLSVQPAFGGYFKYGEWLPLRVAVSNHGPDLDAELRTVVTSGNIQTTYAASAPLPSGAQKEIILYAQLPSFAKNVTVDLVAKGETVQSARADIHPLTNIRYVVALVAPDAEPYGLIEGLELRDTDRTVKLVPVSLRDLPERAQALRNFDALIIADTDTTSLAPAQGEALQAWANNGGRLVIAGGPGAERTLAGLPVSLKPDGLAGRNTSRGVADLAKFAGLEPASADGEFVLAPPATAFGRTLVSQDGQGLVFEQPCGNGYSTYLAFDPGLNPFKSWAGMRVVWEKLLTPGSAYPANQPADASESQMAAQRMGYMLTNLPSLDLPSVRWLAILLGVYILLVGPANYLTLRRMHRLDWAWATVPLLTLVFAGGAFGVGYGMRGNDVVVNQAAIVRVPSTGAPALIRAYVGIFSPSRSAYSFVIGDGALAGPMSIEPNRFGSGPIQPGNLTIVADDPVIVRDVYVNQWSMQSFQVERYAPGNEWALTGKLQASGETVTGTLHNGTPYDLSDLVVVMGNRFAKLGDLQAGADLAVGQALQGANTGGVPFPYALFQESLNKAGPGGPSRGLMLKQNMLDSIFGQDTKMGGNTLPDITVLGWYNESPVNVKLTQGQASYLQTSLLVVTLPFSLAGDRIMLPAGIIPAQALEFQNSAGACGSAGRVYLSNDGAATLEYALPDDLLGATVTRLALVATSDGNLQAQPPQVEIYDWAAGNYTELTEVQTGENEIPEPERYVNPADAKIRVHLDGKNSSTGGCYQYDLSLEAERN